MFKASALLICFALLTLPSCTKKNAVSTIRLDGSSTVFPLSEAAAEEYQKEKRVKVTIGVSGTGGGFKQFCAGAIPIIGASRPIKESEEAQCLKNGIGYVELPVALDGIAIIANTKNQWLSDITKEELKRIWEPQAQGKISKWSQVRAGWPEKEIHLLAPGVDSGTYDYFTKTIVGKEHASRGDITSSEDDNVLIQGVANDEDALAFVGYSYYVENRDKLKLVSVDGMIPSQESIRSGSYKPLSRPLFLYVEAKSVGKKEIKEFMDFYLSKAEEFAKEVGFVPMSREAYNLVKRHFAAARVGTLFGKVDEFHRKSVESILGGKDGAIRG